VTGTCFAELGNHVTCIDSDPAKIEKLRSGRIPFFEPGLAELVQRNVSACRLRFSESIAEGISDTEIIFIAVGTPMNGDGHADLSHVRAAAIEIAKNIDSNKVVVNKSTVPVETGDLVQALIREHNETSFEVTVLSNPEFLREGSAIQDFMKPDRIVIGVTEQSAEAVMRELYAPLEAPIIVTDVRSAEMIKYTANAFLAMRISFINEIARICERVGANVRDIIAGAGSDHRIGTDFMNPGLGFGGSCFPKDVLALTRIAETYGVNPRILPSILRVNSDQVIWTADRLERHLGSMDRKRIGILGLSFKPNTDDVRESPSIALILELLKRGASIAGHDPVAMDAASQILGRSIEYAEDAHAVAIDADAIVVATDWNEYKQLDFKELKRQMRNAVFLDARNLYDSQVVQGAGMQYIGIGHGEAVEAACKATRVSGESR
jgi:UDPglucose 6-dehydrogenase